MQPTAVLNSDRVAGKAAYSSFLHGAVFCVYGPTVYGVRWHGMVMVMVMGMAKGKQKGPCPDTCAICSSRVFADDYHCTRAVRGRLHVLLRSKFCCYTS